MASPRPRTIHETLAHSGLTYRADKTYPTVNGYCVGLVPDRPMLQLIDDVWAAFPGAAIEPEVCGLVFIEIMTEE